MLSKLHQLIDPRRVHGTAVLLVVCLLAVGCAGSSALRRGQNAERRQDYDFAVVEYAKAVRLRPDDTNARVGL